MVGSSPYWSSPTGAAAIAARIASVGRVTVSERRSIEYAATNSGCETTVPRKGRGIDQNDHLVPLTPFLLDATPEIGVAQYIATKAINSTMAKAHASRVSRRSAGPAAANAP